METDEYPPFEIGSILQYLYTGRHISQTFKEDAEQKPVFDGRKISRGPSESQSCS